MVLSVDAAIPYSNVDVIGHMGPVRLFSQKVVHTTSVRVANQKGIVEKVKELETKVSATTHCDVPCKGKTRTKPPSLLVLLVFRLPTHAKAV